MRIIKAGIKSMNTFSERMMYAHESIHGFIRVGMEKPNHIVWKIMCNNRTLSVNDPEILSTILISKVLTKKITF